MEDTVGSFSWYQLGKICESSLKALAESVLTSVSGAHPSGTVKSLSPVNCQFLLWMMSSLPYGFVVSTWVIPKPDLRPRELMLCQFLFVSLEGLHMYTCFGIFFLRTSQDKKGGRNNVTRDCTSWSCRSYEGSEHGGLIQSHGIITLLWPLSLH